MMFIIVHQTSELWLRLFLHELGGVMDCVRKRRARSLVQDARAHLARADAAHRDVGRAFDDDAGRVLARSAMRSGAPRASSRCSTGCSNSMLGNKHAEMLAVHQRDPKRTRALQARARRAVALRRGAAPAQPPRLRHSGIAPVARFQRAVSGEQAGGGRVARRVSQRREGLGPVRARRAAGRPRPEVPALALPSPEDGGAHHRLQAGHRRHGRRVAISRRRWSSSSFRSCGRSGLRCSGPAPRACTSRSRAARRESPRRSAARARPSSPASSSATRRGWRSTYTSRCSVCQRRPSRRIILLVEVTASGISISSAVKPIVMYGRLAMSSPSVAEVELLVEHQVDR